VILFSKLIEHANAVDDGIVIALSNHLNEGIGIESIASKRGNVLRLANVEAIDIMTLLFEIEGYGMTCHTIASAYKEFHIKFSIYHRLSATP